MKSASISLDDLRRRSRWAAALSFLGFAVVAGSLAWSGYNLRRLDDSLTVKTAQLAKLEKQEASLKQRNSALEMQADAAAKEIESLSAATAIARKDLAAANSELAEKLKEKAALEKENAVLETRLGTARKELIASETQYRVADNQLLAAQQIVLRPNQDPPLTALIVPRAKAEKISGSGARTDSRFECVIWLETPDNVRNKIEKATYIFNHPSFPKEPLQSSDPQNNFAVKYVGWGALTRVLINVQLHSGERKELAFNMAKALGLESQTSSEKVSIDPGKIPFDTEKLPIKDLTKIVPPP